MAEQFQSLGKKLFAIARSQGTTCVILFLLFVLTFLGTLEQTRSGLFDVQKKYFTSMIVLHDLPGGFKLPLPGVYLLMVLLSVNLLIGGLVRLRRRWSNAGLFIVHGGIMFLLISSLITHHFTQEGQMTLAPGETSSEFHSYHEWELAISDTSDPGLDIEYIIPKNEFDTADRGRTRTFYSDAIPFDLTVTGYVRNGMPTPAEDGVTHPAHPVIDGFYINRLEVNKANEQNTPALYLTIRDKNTGRLDEDILWGASLQPVIIRSEGKTYTVDLRRRKWDVPFAIHLKKFTRELHPGTMTPRAFESEVVKIEGQDRRDILIRMNEPLRHRGYTFFQSSYFEDPRTGVFSSTLAVVRNPADQFPLVACVVITLGMLIHFGVKLQRHLKVEREQQT